MFYKKPTLSCKNYQTLYLKKPSFCRSNTEKCFKKPTQKEVRNNGDQECALLFIQINASVHNK